MSQSQYIKDILQRANMINANSFLTLMISFAQLSQDETTMVEDPRCITLLLGLYKYLTITHLYLSFSVNKGCQFMHNPQEHHWHAVKRILHYLVGTLHMGVHICPSLDFSIHAYCDAN